jgi:hypothetical protein
MKTLVASLAFVAFAAAPALAGGGCGYDSVAKMSVKHQPVQQMAAVDADTLKLVDGKRLALV